MAGAGSEALPRCHPPGPRQRATFFGAIFHKQKGDGLSYSFLLATCHDSGSFPESRHFSFFPSKASHVPHFPVAMLGWCVFNLLLQDLAQEWLQWEGSGLPLCALGLGHSLGTQVKWTCLPGARVTVLFGRPAGEGFSRGFLEYKSCKRFFPTTSGSFSIVHVPLPPH